MELKVLKPYKPLFFTDKRYVLLYGGRGGGRSYAAAQKVLLDTKHSPYSRVALMRYILGDVRSSIWQEFKDKLDLTDLPEVTSDQAMHYEYQGNVVDGKGFKKSTSQNIAKLKSLAGYNCIIIEEADEVLEEDFDNLDASIRTKLGNNIIILMFNMPEAKHWIIKRWFNLIESEHEGYFHAQPKQLSDTEYIYATYENNIANLTESSINTFESFKDKNPEYYYTMIKGLVSEGKKGRVFKDWKAISRSEYEALDYNEYFGLDFGFSNHPTALVGMKYHNDNVYFKEYLYKPGLTNPDIAKEIQTLDIENRIIADSAEPKSIEELIRLGLDVEGANKGADSVRAGIDLLNSKKVHYVEGDENMATELINYIYRLDKFKQPTNEPIDDFNHLMDACRYVSSKYLQQAEVKLTWL